MTIQTFIKEREEKISKGIEIFNKEYISRTLKDESDILLLNLENGIKSFPHQFAQDLLALVAEEVEKKYGKQGKHSGSLGYQGIVMGIQSYQMDTDKMRDDFLSLLRSSLQVKE